MAKGGARGKGRPKKIVDLVTKTPTEDSTTTQEVGECSYAAITNETVEALKQKAELEIQFSVEKQIDELNQEEVKESKARQIEGDGVMPMRNKGMQLGYIAPVLKKGVPTAFLSSSELGKENEKWRNAVILYVIGDTPTISYLHSFLLKQCAIEGKFEIFYHNDGYFLVRFELRADRDKMIFEGPYSIASRPIIVKEWVADFCFEKEVLRDVPLWIRLPKLPLNCWSGDSLSRIGSVIGKPICADECTSQQKRISYARLLVEIDITQPLKYKIQIEGEDGQLVEQKVFYEWVPIYCQQCKQAGHVCKEKQKEQPKPPLRQWQPKAPEREKVWEMPHITTDTEEKRETAWTLPKKTTPNSVIQVGNLQVPTGNTFQHIEGGAGDTGNLEEKGGDLFPFTFE